MKIENGAGLRFFQTSARASLAMLLVVLGACGSTSVASDVDGGGAGTTGAGGSASGAAGTAPDGGLNGAAGTGSAVAGTSGGAGTGEAPAPCVGAAKGASCEEGICIDGACVTSRCGDGYVDTQAGEECEDDNLASGDGCSLCRFECKANGDCDDKAACNGVETCDLATHACANGTPAANAAACTMADNAAGVCKAGTCVLAGCGNSAVDVGEDCDDGNANDGDGCTTKCKFTCAKNADCDNGNACDGVETCTLATHTCKAGTAVVCSAKSCNGTCNPADGACVYADADKDGVSCDTDCNDADPATFPGGFECKDGKDNDCNVMTADATAVGCECYVDADKDGFAADVTGAIAAAGACPAGYTRKKPVDAKTTDCAPKAAAAFPGQASYFPKGYCTSLGVVCLTFSFDYNCDKADTSTLQENKIASASCVGAPDAFSCSFRSGWVAAQVPACGAKATFRQCTFKDGACTGVDLANQPRSCR